MKTRNGFVSNSSSSSFLLVGIQKNISEITYKMIETKQVIAIGKDLSDGDDVFAIDSLEKLAFFKVINNFEFDTEISFYLAYAFDRDDSNVAEVSVKDIEGDKFKIIKGWCDHNSSNTLDDLLDRYSYDGIDSIPNEIKKYIRKIKLAKIQDEI